MYDISPQRAMDVSQRSRTCLDFIVSCGSATSITAANASRSLLKSGIAVRVGSVLKTAAAAAAVVTDGTELNKASGAEVTVTGTAAVVDDDDDDVITGDSSDVGVVVNDVAVTGTGALYLQNPAAFALATRIFLSCFSV